MKNRSDKIKSIKTGEWDFEFVSPEELDACYNYEFAREIDDLKVGIPEWRKKVPNLSAIFHEYTFAENMKELEALIDRMEQQELIRNFNQIFSLQPFKKDFLPPEIQKYWGQINIALPKYQVYVRARLEAPSAIRKIKNFTLPAFVAASPDFPKSSWKGIKNQKWKKEWAKYWKAPTVKDVASEPSRCLVDVTHKIKEWETLPYGEKKITVSERIEKILKDPYNASSKTAFHLFEFSWCYRNDQIAAAFNRWAEINRPKNFPEPDLNNKLLGAGWQKLAHDKRASLIALGVLRRKRVCSWPEFLKYWPDDRRANDPGNLIRSLKRQKKVADEVIRSFSSKK